MKIVNITRTLVSFVQFLMVASWCNNPDTLQKDGWTFYNGALYKSFDNIWLSHTESENYCQQYGGSLVTIKNAKENAFVNTIIK
ncbi:hypothetical protein ACJMK2_029490 [Sinanodonta woodiana]|uniref:C-type lectin domain-containing protein n=1 Tax=Sinanodonta woodiana TaxID=1069815 RepID=A0ABD3XBU0_SINWO